MAIPKTFVNAKITLIERPTPTGLGGDAASHTILEREVCAIRQPFNSFASAGDQVIRDIDSAIINADNTFWVDLETARDELLQVKAGDVITWESTSVERGGGSGTRAEVVRLNVWEATGLQRSHVEIFTQGQGAA